MRKILIIDDDEKQREDLKQLLTEFGFEVIVAFDGITGIRSAVEFKPDLILCDVIMPNYDGYDVLLDLFKNQNTAGIPFIFISGIKIEMSDLRHGMEIGADDYLIKPIKSGEILKAINSRMNKYDRIRERHEVKFEQHTTKTVNNSKKLHGDDRLLVMVGNHPEILKIGSIVYISAAGEYSNVFTSEGKSLLVQKLLKDWENILPLRYFIRIHRSTIINLDYVKKIEKWFNHSFRIFLKDVNEAFIISRRYSSKLRTRLSAMK